MEAFEYRANYYALMYAIFREKSCDRAIEKIALENISKRVIEVRNDEEIEKKIIEWKAKGYSYAQIGRFIGKSKQVVYKMYMKNRSVEDELKVYVHNRLTEKEKEEITRLAPYHKYSEIAVMLDLKPHTVYKYIKVNNIRRKKMKTYIIRKDIYENARVEKGLSTKMLKSKTKLSASTINRINLNLQVTENTAFAIANALNLKVNELCEIYG